MLLASVLGMRAGDIKALRLSDVDWRAKTVSFVQRKTKVANVLPMPEEVWLAVADYIKCERPDVDDDRLFVTACASYRAVESSHTASSTEFATLIADPQAFQAASRVRQYPGHPASSLSSSSSAFSSNKFPTHSRI